MAHIETWWRCPGCHGSYSTRKEAEDCAKGHVWSEQWAVSHRYKGKAVKVMRGRGVEQALKEAEESDNEPKAKTEMNNPTIRLIKGGAKRKGT